MQLLSLFFGTKLIVKSCNIVTLDRQNIGVRTVSEQKNFRRMTQLFEKFEDAPSREIPSIVSHNPEFCDRLLSTADHEIWWQPLTRCAPSIGRITIVPHEGLM